MPTKECPQCHNLFPKAFNMSTVYWKVRKFCSKRCQNMSQLGKATWNTGTKGIMKAWNKGLTKADPRVQKYAYNSGNFTTDRVSKDKNVNWKGGVTPIHQQIRTSTPYKRWREAVFKRDDYRCLDCGEKGGSLHADHIYPFAYFPRLRFDINNGRTLCVECHRKTPTYATKSFQFATAL